MPKRYRILPLIAVLSLATAVGAADAPAKVEVTVDTSQVPELAEWGEQAKKLIEEWHPRIAETLASDNFQPPNKVQLIFEKNGKGVAATTGTTIRVTADWVKKHPDDLGMIVHELTHVVQNYPANDAGWLVEGIADYVRMYQYEPQTKLSGIDPARQSYRDGYRTTAMFLAWIAAAHDKQIVSKLNDAFRHKKYRYDLFRQYP